MGDLELKVAVVLGLALRVGGVGLWLKDDGLRSWAIVLGSDSRNYLRRVRGYGFRVQGLGFWVQGFKVQGLGLRA